MLIGGVLRTQPENPRTEPGQIGGVIAEGAGLRRAPTGARDGILALRQGLAGHARTRVAVKDRAPRAERGKVHIGSPGRAEDGRRQRHPYEMIAGAIVDGTGNMVWKLVQAAQARASLRRVEARCFRLALLSWPQAAMMSRPRGLRTGLA